MRNASALRVGRPLESFIGPGMPDILAQNDVCRAFALGDLAACLSDTGGFRFMPWALADARPLAFSPPLGFLPSLRVHAAVLGVAFLLATAYTFFAVFHHAFFFAFSFLMFGTFHHFAVWHLVHLFGCFLFCDHVIHVLSSGWGFWLLLMDWLFGL